MVKWCNGDEIVLGEIFFNGDIMIWCCANMVKWRSLKN